MTKLKSDLYKTRQKAVEKLYKDLDESNKLWHGAIGIAITLSSSCLVITTALVKNLFATEEGVINLSSFVIGAWILQFLSIVSGIIAKVEGSIFFGNLADDSAKILKQCDQKISKGVVIDEIETDYQYVIPGNIYWGGCEYRFFCNSYFSFVFCFSGESIFRGNMPNYIYSWGIAFIDGKHLLIEKKKNKIKNI